MKEIKKNVKYIIHSCNNRLQYVNDYLIPSMMKQGITSNNIILYNDNNNIGCLKSWFASCKFLEEKYPDVDFWHLQDDVVICNGFAELTNDLMGDKIINGFVCKKHNPNNWHKIGLQPVSEYWMSFQCNYIPSKYINAFVKWFMLNILIRKKYKHYYEHNRHDDFFFWKSVKDCFPNDKIYNLYPCLVDHIDYLIGGSVITTEKQYVREAVYWNEERRVLKN